MDPFTMNVILFLVLVGLVLLSLYLYKRYHSDVLQKHKKTLSDYVGEKPSQTISLEHTQHKRIHDNIDDMIENPYKKGVVRVSLENPLWTGIEFGIGFMLVATLFFLLVYLAWKLIL